MSQGGQTSINIPQLLAVAIVGFLAIRWYMSKPATGNSGASRSGSSSRAIDPAKVEQVSAMFPQMDRRTIAWDLNRNGQNVSATTDRILSGRTLDNPPPSFQPNLPAPAAQGSQAAAASRPKPAVGGSNPDLITRYNLQSRVNSKGKEAVQSDEQKRLAWSSDKAARAEGLRKRREEMVLAARRKMMEKEQEAS